MRDLVKQAFGVTGSLGIVTGALSAMSLTATAFRLGLSEFWETVLGYWHKLMHETLLESILRPLPFDVPPWLHEPLILWLITSGICLRTLVQARIFGRRAIRLEGHEHFGDSAEISGIGEIERWAFSWSFVIYLLVAVIFSLFLLPLVLLRLIYGARTFYVRIPGQVPHSIRFILKLEHGESFNYKTIARTQVVVFLLAYIIMLATNAGLPD